MDLLILWDNETKSGWQRLHCCIYLQHQAISSQHNTNHWLEGGLNEPKMGFVPMFSVGYIVMMTGS